MDPISGTLLGMGIGDILSMVLFLEDQKGSRKGAHEIVQLLQNAQTIRGYIDWLRRQDHKELMVRIAGAETQLLRDIGELGVDLRGFAGAVMIELRASHDDVLARVDHLKQQFREPVLSPVPLRRRPLIPVPLLGRDESIQWLRNSTCDAVVSGQPGSGKTYLLYRFAGESGARFLLTKDAGAAMRAVLNGCPPVIIVDDAATSMEVIQRLRHLRDEHALKFRLIAICWPFEAEGLRQEMAVTKSDVLELDLLPRRLVAELIAKVVHDAGYEAPNEIVREITSQAAGRPGLAVELTLRALQQELPEVLRGEALAGMITDFYRRVAGPQATQLLAAFAVGGRAGMELQVVAEVLGLSPASVHESVRNMAPGGVLEVVSRTRLAARPKALRRALLKEVFFNTTGPCLPLQIFDALYAAAEDRDAALRTVLGAAQIGAVIDHSWLHGLMEASEHDEVWEMYSSLGARPCIWVMESQPERLAQAVDAGLHYVPERIIPMLLDQAVGDRRPLNGSPSAPMRRLGDWVTHSKGGTPEALGRRQKLFGATATWLQANGDLVTALKAFSLCFALHYEYSDSDPGDGMKVTFYRGLLGPVEVAALHRLWPRLLEILRARGVPDWNALTETIESWLSPATWSTEAPGDDFYAVTRGAAKTMIQDLVTVCAGHNGFLRWAHIHAQQAGLDAAAIPVSEEYLTLCPPERLVDGWREVQKRWEKNVEALAEAWAQLPFDDVIARLSRYESESRAVGHTWPRLTGYLCSILAMRPDVCAAVVTEMMDADLGPDVIEPFIARLLGSGASLDNLLTRCLQVDAYRPMAIVSILVTPVPSMLAAVTGSLHDYTGVIERIGYQSVLPEAVLDMLLNHNEPAVQLAAALCEFHSKDKLGNQIRLPAAWRAALLSGMAAAGDIRELRCGDELPLIAAYDRSLARDMLAVMIASESSLLRSWRLNPSQPLIEFLSDEERAELISLCRSRMVRDLLGRLVGDNVDLFRRVLSSPELRDNHLAPLEGDPGAASWAEKALLALQAGYSAADVSHAALGGHWQFSGRASSMWQGWVEKFGALIKHPDERLQAVAKAGDEWASERRDQELRRDRHADIEGFFGE